MILSESVHKIGERSYSILQILYRLIQSFKVYIVHLLYSISKRLGVIGKHGVHIFRGPGDGACHLVNAFYGAVSLLYGPVSILDSLSGRNDGGIDCRQCRYYLGHQDSSYDQKYHKQTERK